jgi:hypothetical protein
LEQVEQFLQSRARNVAAFLFGLRKKNENENFKIVTVCNGTRKKQTTTLRPRFKTCFMTTANGLNIFFVVGVPHFL